MPPTKRNAQTKPTRGLRPDAPRRLAPLLRRAWYGLNQGFRRRIAIFGLTPDQFIALRWLSEGPPAGLTQTDLAALMSSDANTITGLLARAQKVGLIERCRHQTDGRAKLIRITPHGQRLFRRARPVALAWQQRVLQALPTADHDRFLTQLQMMADRARDEADRMPDMAPAGHSASAVSNTPRILL